MQDISSSLLYSHKSGNVVQAERENNMLQAQVSMLMTMLNEADEAGDEEM